MNHLQDELIQNYLDSINFEVQDRDLIVLNQLATIKRLINRKSFSLDDRQIMMIHQKFANLFN